MKSVYLRELLNDTNFNNTTSYRSYGSHSTFLRGSFTILLRAGFLLVQISSIPTSNVNQLLFYNFLDLALTTSAYGLIGYTVSFGNTENPWFGIGGWINSEDADIDQFVLGWSSCVTATALITTFLAGRANFLSFSLLQLLFATLIHPLIAHWIWSKRGFMHKFTLLGHRVSLKDHSGCLVTHITGAFIGFIGCVVLGRRLLLLRNIPNNSVSSNANGFAIIGYLMILTGVITQSLPTPEFELNHIPFNYIGLILINNLFAMAGSSLVVICLNLMISGSNFNYWILLQMIQSSLAGVVAISAGVDVLNPFMVFTVSVCVGILFFITANCVYFSSLEDYCNILAIHFISGVMGILVPPIFGSRENLGSGSVMFLHLSWQIACLGFVLFFLLLTMGILISVLSLMKVLRNREDSMDHNRAKIILKQLKRRCCLQRLFKPTTIILTPENRDIL